MRRKNFYAWCIENNRNDLIEYWNTERNGDIKDTKISDRTKYWFSIEKEHEDIFGIINDITTKKKGATLYINFIILWAIILLINMARNIYTICGQRKTNFHLIAFQ